jgi:hypothetical protein
VIFKKRTPTFDWLGNSGRPLHPARDWFAPKPRTPAFKSSP